MQPFFVCLPACAVIWIMVDLYGTWTISRAQGRSASHLYFYALQVPKMLVQSSGDDALFHPLHPAGLNRRNELVALQSGACPHLDFLALFLFGIIWVAVLAYDLTGPPLAEVTPNACSTGEGQARTRQLHHAVLRR